MTFRPIIGYENRYEIDENGNIRSLERYFTDSIGRKCHKKAKYLSPFINHYGYKMVLLYDDKHHRNDEYVHKLVYMTFNHISDIGKNDIDHIDRDKNNCSLSNLELVSHQENMWRYSYTLNGNIVKKGHSYKEWYEKHHNSQGQLLRDKCKHCHKPIDPNKTHLCFHCYNLLINRGCEKPTKKELLKDIINQGSAVKVAKEYNVSSPTIRKWLREYNLPTVTWINKFIKAYLS